MLLESHLNALATDCDCLRTIVFRVQRKGGLAGAWTGAIRGGVVVDCGGVRGGEQDSSAEEQACNLTLPER